MPKSFRPKSGFRSRSAIHLRMIACLRWPSGASSTRFPSEAPVASCTILIRQGGQCSHN
jgi:hypothetical protein